MKCRNVVSASALFLMFGSVGCTTSSNTVEGNRDASLSTGGIRGDGGKSAAGGSTGSGGAVSTGGTSSAQTGSGGSAGGTAGSTGSAVGGSATAGTTGGGGSTGAAGSTSAPIDGGPPPAGGEVDLWIEAESPDNTQFEVKPAKCAKTCVTEPKEGDECCRGGGELTWMVGPKRSYVIFNKVTVPKAGAYDVTWWYHCGLFDHYHDSDCGGKPVPTWMTWYNPAANPQPGCRGHLITVNGKQVVGPNGEQYWQVPCFGGSWTIIHAATTTLTLAAGDNTIQFGAPHINDEDAVDLDAMHVTAEGKGTPPKSVAPTALAGDGRK